VDESTPSTLLLLLIIEDQGAEWCAGLLQKMLQANITTVDPFKKNHCTASTFTDYGFEGRFPKAPGVTPR